MTCLEVEELAPFYVAGALHTLDEAAIRAHVASCGNHAELLAELEAAVAQPEPRAHTAASPALRSKILTAISADELTVPARQQARRFTWAPLTGVATAAAVMVVLLGLLAWNIQLRADSSERTVSTFAIALNGPGGASGLMFYDDAQETGVISVEGLSPLPPGRTYQVWANTPHGPQSCGLLAISQTSAAFARMTGEVAKGQAIFVTVEPEGGSLRPSGPKVMTSAVHR